MSYDTRHYINGEPRDEHGKPKDDPNDIWIYRGKVYQFGIVSKWVRVHGPYFSRESAERDKYLYEKDGYIVVIRSNREKDGL